MPASPRTKRATEYIAGPYAGVDDAVLKGLAAVEPAHSVPAEVARAVVQIVPMPHGSRPPRVHVDPDRDGADVINGVADRLRKQMLERFGLRDLLHPAHPRTSGQTRRRQVPQATHRSTPTPERPGSAASLRHPDPRAQVQLRQIAELPADADACDDAV